jgi:hypothetical protein
MARKTERSGGVLFLDRDSRALFAGTKFDATSLCSQGDHRVYARGTPCGNIAR